MGRMKREDVGSRVPGSDSRSRCPAGRCGFLPQFTHWRNGAARDRSVQGREPVCWRRSFPTQTTQGPVAVPKQANPFCRELSRLPTLGERTAVELSLDVVVCPNGALRKANTWRTEPQQEAPGPLAPLRVAGGCRNRTSAVSPKPRERRGKCPSPHPRGLTTHRPLL